ncbi:unnamed protein product [Dicrocoelium dendriticum]|nr:unnamed protein product [Dicrocoelium dendriticum]
MVSKLQNEVDRLTEDLSQINAVYIAGSNKCTELTIELSQLKQEHAQKMEELKQLDLRLSQKQSKIEEGQVELKTAQEALDNLRKSHCESSQTVVAISAELEETKAELIQSQIQLKRTTSELQEVQLMFQELEYNVHQLTKQLEQSEWLRTTAEEASNKAMAEATSTKVEMAKQTDKLNSYRMQLEAASQRISTLESVTRQQGTSLRGLDKESSHFSVVQRVEKELAHWKKYCNEKDAEARSLRQKVSQLHSELMHARSSLEAVTSTRHVEDSTRSRFERELVELRELKTVLTEQSENQRTLIEKLQEELKAERSRALELRSVVCAKELSVEKASNEVEKLSKLKEELEEKLRERQSAVDALNKGMESCTTRLNSTLQNLAHIETELLETKQKLELADTSAKKYKEENQQYAIIVESLEARLVERNTSHQDPKSTTAVYDHGNPVDRAHTTKLIGELQTVKNQLAESKKSAALLKTERTHLQDKVNRLQGELLARSDALKRAAEEMDRNRQDHKAKETKLTNEWIELTRQIEAKWKDECAKVQQLRGQLEEQRNCQLSLMKNNDELNKEIARLHSTLEDQCEKKVTSVFLSAVDGTNHTQLDRQLLETKSLFEIEKQEDQQTKLILEDNLHQKTEDLKHFPPEVTARKGIDRSIQTIVSTHERPEESLMGTKRSKRQLRFTDSVAELGQLGSWSDAPTDNISSMNLYTEDEIVDIPEGNQNWTPRRTSSNHPAGSLESRVKALKLANQQLRAEVQAACVAVRLSNYDTSPLGSEISHMLKDSRALDYSCPHLTDLQVKRTSVSNPPGGTQQPEICECLNAKLSMRKGVHEHAHPVRTVQPGGREDAVTKLRTTEDRLKLSTEGKNLGIMATSLKTKIPRRNASLHR